MKIYKDDLSICDSNCLYTNCTKSKSLSKFLITLCWAVSWSYCVRFVQQAGVTFASIGGESSALAEPKLLLSQALSTHSLYT